MYKKYRILIICAAILFLCFVGEASAKTWYVDDDGGADFTKIQEAIDAALPTDTIFVWNGTYYTNGVSVSKNWITLQGEDANTTIIHGKWSAGKVVHVTGDHVSVSDFTVTNSTESGRGIYVNGDNCLISENVLYLNNIGICVASSGNCCIENNVANSNRHNGIELDHSSNCKIENNVANSNRHNGIELDRSSNCKIENNVANSNRHNGIELDRSSNCKIENNVANSNILHGISLSGSGHSNVINNIADSNSYCGIYLSGSGYSNVINNIANSNYDGIGLVNSENSNVTNNTVTNGSGIVLVNSENSNVTNNTVTNGSGIVLSESDNCNVINNTANNSNRYGISLSESDNCNVINNIANNSNNCGISLSESDNCNVINNIANNSNNCGIYLSGSGYSNVINNIANNSNSRGIYLSGSGHSNVINNIANNSNDCGISLYQSENCNVTNNIVDANKVGINLVSASTGNSITRNNITKNKEYGMCLNRSGNNEIYHNNFIDNNKQAYERYGDNNWDKGPLIGGNYWSDHVCHGNPSNGSESYTKIDTGADSVDNYPFEDPDGWVRPPPPKIISSAPESPVNDIERAIRTFNITVNQTVNVSWQINGSEVQLNKSVTETAYTNTSVAVGTLNVSVIVTNANGSDMQTWDWIVTKVTPEAPEITSYTPETPVYDIEGAIRTFNIIVNQTVNVSWQMNGTEVQTNESVTEANLYEHGAATGTWNVSAIVTNANGTDMQAWVWNVTSKENQPPVANFTYSPANPVVAQPITFNASNSTDPDGDITNYEWIFGDGNTTNTTEPTTNHTYAPAGTFTVTLTVTDDDGATNATSRAITVSEGLVFDTGTGTYPSIAGTHTGTITTNVTIAVSKLYTYPCAGTGGHTEHVIITNESGIIIAEADWDGYQVDGHNITFDGSLTLVANATYSYTICTGSYPQIVHADSKTVAGGTITCTSFVDANGNEYVDWIPAIRLGD